MDIKRRRRAGDRAKINVYVDPEIEELYRIGRMNCWDTPGLVREAVTKAFQPEDKSA
jgi:hypothetical protein